MCSGAVGVRDDEDDDDENNNNDNNKNAIKAHLAVRALELSFLALHLGKVGAEARHHTYVNKIKLNRYQYFVNNYVAWQSRKVGTDARYRREMEM